MKNLNSFGIALLLLAFCCSPALGATSNTGKVDYSVIGQHVLTKAPFFPVGKCNMLYAPSEADSPDLRARIAAETGGIVDYYDARSGVPTLNFLQQYCCVFTWVNHEYYDNVLFGNVLADYVDGGGTVVLGAYCTYTSLNHLSGRIMTTGYSPVYSPTGTNHGTYSDYAGNGSTKLHDGVTTYEASSRDYLALQGSGIQDGSYLDGEIAQAYRPDFRVIYSNGACSLYYDDDWPRLLSNACGAVQSKTVYITSKGLGVGTSKPKAEVDIHGIYRLKRNAQAPEVCNTELDGAVALTHTYKLCICIDGLGWQKYDYYPADEPCEWE